METVMLDSQWSVTVIAVHPTFLCVRKCDRFDFIRDGFVTSLRSDFSSTPKDSSHSCARIRNRPCACQRWLADSKFVKICTLTVCPIKSYYPLRDALLAHIFFNSLSSTLSILLTLHFKHIRTSANVTHSRHVLSLSYSTYFSQSTINFSSPSFHPRFSYSNEEYRKAPRFPF